MRLYLDSSYLFRLYSQEKGHEAVKELLNRCDAVASAYHARAEFASIVLRHRREQSDPGEWLDLLHHQFLNEVRSGDISLLPLDEAVMTRLEITLRQALHTIFLRAADALHLACAAENGFTEVYSNDRHFLAAAPLFGLKGLNVIE